MKKYHLKEFFRSQKTRIDYQKELNKEQYRVIQEASGPSLILAGAGSGKTRTLVYLTAYLLEKGVAPHNIMLVTFTNKAAREMLHRTEMLLKYPPKGLWGGTFHHLANLILKKYAHLLGYKNNFLILDDADAKTFLKRCIAELKIDANKRYFPKADLIHTIISFSKNSQRSIREVIGEKFSHIDPQIIHQIEKIDSHYHNKKKKANVMDFDDLLINWRNLLLHNSDIARSLSSQFHYILVDEYQDTNTLQAEIIERLSVVHRNVIVVGDDAQSIYSFRAANIDNILNFPKVYPEAKIFTLETNYRSTPEILNLANSSIQHNRLQYKKNLKSMKKNAMKPALVPLSDADEQAVFVCQKVIDLLEEGRSLNHIAVLFRSTYQALELEIELNKRNIPYEIRGGIRFFEQAHIKDILSYLRILSNPHDELSWMRILQLYPGIGISTAQTIWENIEKSASLEDILHISITLPERAQQGYRQLKKTLNNIFKIYREHEGRNVISSIIDAILHGGYRQYLESTFENAQERREDLEQLANFSLRFKKLDEFLSEVSLSEAFKGQSYTSETDTPDERLILTTIHQAKGLEWQTVFLIGLVEGQFPHRHTFYRPNELEEERRLFYVAVTRAKDELYLTYPIISSSYRTGQYINHPSPFLKEIDEDLFELWEVENENTLPVITLEE